MLRTKGRAATAAIVVPAPVAAVVWCCWYWCPRGNRQCPGDGHGSSAGRGDAGSARISSGTDESTGGGELAAAETVPTVSELKF